MVTMVTTVHKTTVVSFALDQLTKQFSSACA